MGSYGSAARFYDLLYSGEKDYAAEAAILTSLIRAAQPEAKSILDVGCGTGAHARVLIDTGFRVDGVDLEPEFVRIAQAKCPEGSFVVGDMVQLNLPDHYDVVTCLFSAIGYVRTKGALKATVLRMRQHLNPGGVLLVDPWLEPGQLTHGWVSKLVAESDGLAVCRVSRTLIDGLVSRIEFEYLIGTAERIEHLSEVHELGLFTQAEMEDAFRAAGFDVERQPKALRTRGIYVGQLAPSAA